MDCRKKRNEKWGQEIGSDNMKHQHKLEESGGAVSVNYAGEMFTKRKNGVKSKLLTLERRHLLSAAFLKDPPFWPPCARVDLPQTCSAQERVAIMPALDAFRQLIQFLGVATAQHDVIGDE